MSYENEDIKVMKASGNCSGGFSCSHMYASSVRVKKPGSHVRQPHWLQIYLLVVLLAGHACNQTSAAHSTPSLPATTAQTSVYYFVDVTVDVTGQKKNESEITSWLRQVFQNKLENCVSSNHEKTTAAPTSLQTTSANTSYETTPLESNTTTTAPITLKTNTTTTNTTLQSDITSTTAATTMLQSHVTTTPAATTMLQSHVTTTPAATTMLQSHITTTPAATTMLQSHVTTTPAPTAVLQSHITTTPAATAVLQSHITTTLAPTAVLQSHITTTPAPTAVLQSHITTTPAATAVLQSHITTTPAPTAMLQSHITTTATTNHITTEDVTQSNNWNNSSPNGSRIRAGKQRVPHHIGVTLAQTLTSESSNSNTTGLFQGIEVSCAMKTAIKKTNCTVTLRLRQRIPPCCILRTLCAASNTLSNISVVGKRANRLNSLQNKCDSNPQEAKICSYTGKDNASCEESYVASKYNTTNCGPEKEKNNCSCSAYCNGTDAYYTFRVEIENPKINMSYLLSMISQLKHPLTCPPSRGVPCPLPSIASEYKDAKGSCGNTDTICRVILSFAHEVPICNVSAAVMIVLQSVKGIRYDGPVTRAAICGNSVGGNPLNSLVTWSNINLKPSDFCMVIQETQILQCNGGNVLLQLDEQCVQKPVTTPSPKVTTMQPDTTNSSVNVTSPPLNTTTGALNATTTVSTLVSTNVSTNVSTTASTTVSPTVSTLVSTNVSTNVSTTASTNVSTNVSTTVSTNVSTNVATTAANVANVTVTATATLNTTTGNESVSVIPSERPTTNQTAESSESQANALLERTTNVSKLNSSQVDQLVSQLENLLAGPNISLALGNTSINIVSNLLGATPETLAASSNRIIGIVDTVGLKLLLEETTETLLSPAVALSVKAADGSNFQETFFSISDPSDVQVRGDPRHRRSARKDSSIPQGSIRLPPSLTQDLTSEEQQLASRVQFNFYQKSTVFQDRSLGIRKLNSGILGASVANLSITGLQDDVIIHLRNTEPVPANFVATCVFWDFTLNKGSGGWNPNGCSVRNSTDNETVCGCNHLTSFAILLDLSRQPVTSRIQATILTFITYIGCGISAIFLSITLLTYLAFGKLRKDIPSKILIQLCLALLMLNLVFLVDAWLALYPDAVGLCISTAWFLHYFLLVSFTWMGLEAIHMYLALVKVFNSYISRYMLKFSLVGWGVPMIVVIIVIAIDKNNYGLVSYGKFDDGTSDTFCWLKNDNAFYVAVVAYFCVIFLFNFSIFIVVLVQLCRLKKQNPHNVQHRTTLQDVRSVAGITILLGLTWGFAFFAWGPLNLPFMYLFAIFNSFQGFFIFVLHCAVKENVRRQWRTYLCCGRMRLAENSEWSRTATQKTVKKASVTRLTSLQSSKSSQFNNSSSSSSFLVSDSSEQFHGIGSPFEDRAITADEDHNRDVILNEINRQHRHQSAP
ncbi:adhesion G-protein coupled receptor G2 isoform X1 [Thunnus thynnus]|uniref:adhesion G-protein coupled receptor G2 isoform X1 n=1 Tax=Thunnus thynnus TaxID=8237 RepID=UPI0035275A9C